jgi:hypothetical protein
MERKEHPIKFVNKATNRPDSSSGSTMAPSATPEGTAGSPLAPVPDSDSDEDEASSSDEQPEFIHLDRPCDDEMVQHYVRNGHNMSGHMTNVGDICTTPHKVLLEGAKLLRTKLACWGVSREYYDILMKLAELRKAT